MNSGSYELTVETLTRESLTNLIERNLLWAKSKKAVRLRWAARGHPKRKVRQRRHSTRRVGKCKNFCVEVIEVLSICDECNWCAMRDE